MDYEASDRSQIELREQLQHIQEEINFVPTSEAALELVQNMMEHLGDPDPILRDELIYSTLRDWVTKGVFHPRHLRQLLSIALDDRHLFYRIGEEQTDSVFMRSFSALIIPLVMWADRELPFLDAPDVRRTVHKLTSYIKQENDLRGYTGEKGWAHAAAHAADAVEDIVQSMYISSEDLCGFLEGFKTQLCQARYTFIHEEDERIASAVVALLDRNLVEDMEICRWISDLGDTPKVGNPPVDLVTVTNIKNFLRSLYFRLLPCESMNRFIEPIHIALNGKLFRP